MHFEGSSAPVAEITADLALVLYPQSMELIEPIGDWFSIPAKG